MSAVMIPYKKDSRGPIGGNAMYHYKLYGMNICSDLEFSQLCPGSSQNQPQVLIEQTQMPPEISGSERGQYAFGAERGWLHNRTAWIMAEGGNRLRYRLKEGGRPSYLRTYLLGYGMAMLAMQQGKLAIHCSAVRNHRGAVLIAGESGSGKSTLTTELLARGFTLIADDMVVAEPRKGQAPIAYPAFPYQKLCRDAALSRGYALEDLAYIDEDKDKFLVPYPGEFSTEPAAIRGVMILRKASQPEPTAVRLKGMESFYGIAGNLFLRKLLGDDKFKPENGQKYLEFAAQTPIYMLTRPEGKETLDQMMKLAEKCLEGL